MGADERVLYEPDERCPLLLSIGVGFQGVMLLLVPTTAGVVAVSRVAGQGEDYLSWAFFASLIACGVVTILQAGHMGRIGGRHILLTAAGGPFIAVCVAALVEGGPPFLATLIVVSTLVQFAMVAWLPLLRRIITPVITGTALILLGVTIIPIGFDSIKEVPAGTSPAAVPVIAGATLAALAALALRSSGPWRLWSPLISVIVGSAVAALFGVYDARQVLEATWIGIPMSGFAGLDLTPGLEFWALLPAFVIVVLINNIKNIGDVTVVQRVSQRRPRATDFRLVQGALNANGLGILLTGIAGTMPTTISSSANASFIQFTGVASRRVGYAAGGSLLTLAICPKLTAVLLTIPNPVMGAYLLLIMGLLVVEGMRTITQDGLDPKKSAVVGVALVMGLGLENAELFTQLPAGAWVDLFSNGITVGTLAAILMTLFAELTSPRSRRLETVLNISALSQIDAFLRELAANISWNEVSTDRLCAAGEEALSSMQLLSDDRESEEAPPLLVVARPDDGTVEMEFIAVFEAENLEDRLAYLVEQPELPSEHEVSFRLLRHYASSVHHHKYRGIDVVKVQVEGSSSVDG